MGRAGYDDSRYSAILLTLDRIRGVEDWTGSTMTGSVYEGRPSLRTELGGAFIERNVASTSGNSSHTVRYGRRL